MSRIGKLPVEIPSGVKASMQGAAIEVEGPKGKLRQMISQLVKVNIEDKQISVSTELNSKQAKADYGTTRALINNMVKGVSEGWTKSLELVGVGFTAQLSGNKLTLATGYSHKVDVMIPTGVDAKVQKTSISLESCDKALVGQLAATIRAVCPPEPYLGKGIKYSDEQVRRKAGKSAK